MKLGLPFPDKVLWPNGRGHHFAVSTAKKKHKAWAYYAALNVIVDDALAGAPALRLVATFHPKTRHAIDKDNASASLKAYQDGIADAIGVNDSIFAEPAIHFGNPIKGGHVTIEVIEA